MKKLFKLSLVLSLLIFCIKVSIADSLPVSLYINNQAYSKPVFSNKGVLYVAVDEALPFLGLKVVRQGRILCGMRSGYHGPACPESQSPALLFLDGKPIVKGVLVHRDRPWISVPMLAKTLGYLYQYNSETGIVDLMSPSLNILAGTFPSQAELHPAKPPAEKKESKEKTPISVDIQAPDSDIYSTQDPTTYEIRTNFSLQNTADHPVNGVKATLVYLDGYGKPLVSHVFSVGTMAAHSNLKKEDYWINYTGISNPKVKVDLDWDGKAKE